MSFTLPYLSKYITHTSHATPSGLGNSWGLGSEPLPELATFLKPALSRNNSLPLSVALRKWLENSVNLINK